MIQIETVTRTYGQKVAVDRLTLHVPPGEVFAFLGPNGAGKTTTIKMMVGLLKPSKGSIRIDGCDVVGQSLEAKQVVGYVPDEPYLYDKLTGREFLRFVAQMYDMASKSVDAAIEKQVEQFELHEFIDRLAESYSHGMRQRITFASALLHHPKLLIVDEPMVGLDPRSARRVKEIFSTYARQGNTVFMSTHTLAIAEEIAGRIGVIDHGRILFLGSVAELRQRLSLGGSSLEDLFLALTEENSITLNSAGPQSPSVVPIPPTQQNSDSSADEIRADSQP
jgi:ABC-2 type transport system ATP-binding protein